jgi:catechol 2,3-dioxygenase-like lactoylglutathione lyase family enzyme
MEHVTGIGGIFFKTADAETTRKWYAEMLGIDSDPAWGGTAFMWREHDTPDTVGMTVWSPMPDTTKKFDPSSAKFMVNYRVRNLDAILAQLRAGGARVDDKVDDTEYGKFAWTYDPDGNKIELWEPPAETPEG